jgi:hypothetical protein
MTRKYNTLNKIIDTFTPLAVKDCKECYVDSWSYGSLSLGYCSFCKARGRNSNPMHVCGQPWKICESYGCTYDASQKCHQCNFHRTHENHLHNHQFIIKSNYEPICFLCKYSLNHPVHRHHHKFEILTPLPEKGESCCKICAFPESKHKYSVFIRIKRHNFKKSQQEPLEQVLHTQDQEKKVGISA